MVLTEGCSVGAVARDSTSRNRPCVSRCAEADRIKGRTGPTTAEREEFGAPVARELCLALGTGNSQNRAPAAFFAKHSDEIRVHRGGEASW